MEDYAKSKFAPQPQVRRIFVFELEQIPVDYTGIAEINKYGLYWFNGGRLHRRDGAAVIRCDGSKQYWFNGKMVSAQVVFDQLTDEEKLKAVWEMDQWITKKF